jgi:hypothetical protein
MRYQKKKPQVISVTFLGLSPTNYTAAPNSSGGIILTCIIETSASNPAWVTDWLPTRGFPRKREGLYLN